MAEGVDLENPVETPPQDLEGMAERLATGMQEQPPALERVQGLEAPNPEQRLSDQ